MDVRSSVAGGMAWGKVWLSWLTREGQGKVVAAAVEVPGPVAAFGVTIEDGDRGRMLRGPAATLFHLTEEKETRRHRPQCVTRRRTTGLDAAQSDGLLRPLQPSRSGNGEYRGAGHGPLEVDVVVFGLLHSARIETLAGIC